MECGKYKENVQIFKDVRFGEVRVIEKNGQPWFVGKDISDVLEYRMPSDMVRILDDDEKATHKVQTLSGMQDMLIINESGLYSAVLKSRKAEAKKFRKWVTSEVLPSIRKHGAYMTDNTLEQALTSPDFLIKLATNLKEEKEKRLLAEQEIEKNKPKVIFADAVSTSNTTILIGELAKLLKQNGIDIGGGRLFAWLRDKGYLIKRKGADYNVPTQKSMNLGLFEIKETVITHSDGHTNISRTTKVTGKGQQYFINKFLC